MKNRLAVLLRDIRPVLIFTLITGIAVFVYWDLLFQVLVNRVALFSSGISSLPIAFSSLRSILLSILFLFPLGYFLSRENPFTNRGEPMVRIVLCISALLITWQLAGEGYNYYLDSWLILDRILIVLFAVAICYSYAFVPLFLLVTLSYYSQYFYPFEWFYTYDIRPIFNILLTGYVLLLFKPGRNSSKLFFTLILLMQMGSYFISGVAKVVISPNVHAWFTENELFLLAMGTHLRGWWYQNVWIAEQIANFLDVFRVPITLYILVIEIFCLFALKNAKYSKILLFSFCSMHILIAFMTGIVFWYWLLANVILLGILYWDPTVIHFKSGRDWWLQSSILVVLSFIIFHPIMYGWHDARYHWIMDVEVTDSEGQLHVLNKNEFGGYSYYFTHAEFQKLVDKKIGSNNGHSATLKEVRKFRNADLSNIEETLDEVGINHFDASYHNSISEFLRTYFTHYNQQPGKRGKPIVLTPLRQLNMYHHETDHLKQDLTVDRVQLIFKEYLYTADSGFVNFDKTVILDESLTD